MSEAKPRKQLASKAKPRKQPASKAKPRKQVASKAKPQVAQPASAKAANLEGAVFQKIRSLALAFPDTKLTMTWGSPHFRVGEKIFCGFGAEDGKQVLGVKLVMSHARAIVKDKRFWPAAYVGKHGWVSMDVTQRKSWAEVAALIRESYGLIAPKASLAKLR